MDNLNTNQITLGNMGQIDVAQESPMESKDTGGVNVAQETPPESKDDTKTENEDTKSDNNILMLGGLLVLFLLFNKKL